MIHISNLLEFFLQGGPKKIGISEYKYGLEILQLLKARDKMKDDFGKLVKCRFWKWPIQSILSLFQTYNSKSKVVVMIVEMIM